MARRHVFTAARILRAACFLSSLSALSGVAGFAYAATDGAPAVTAQNAAPHNTTNKVPDNVPANARAPLPAGAAKAAPVQAATKPLWTDLTPAQQQALAPLAGEWDKLNSARKSKWLAIGNKYASMKPAEQQRVQARMREWIKLTPEQRRIARESYARTKKLDPNQKSEQWQKYQQLPEEQKKKLASDAASRKRVATLPPASQARSKTVQPIKSAPKPVLEQSVTPQAATQSALQPSPQPATK
jgi:hypothetical protein